MKKLDKINSQELIEQVKSGNLAVEKFQKYKADLNRNVYKNNKKRTKLKQQIYDINGRPTERDFKPHHFYRTMLALSGIGAVAGVALGQEPGIANNIIDGFMGAEAGAIASVLGLFVYATKPISNKLNKEIVKYKAKKLNALNERIKEDRQKYDSLSAEQYTR